MRVISLPFWAGTYEISPFGISPFIESVAETNFPAVPDKRLSKLYSNPIAPEPSERVNPIKFDARLL